MEKWYEDKNLVRKGLILCDLEYNYKLLINGVLKDDSDRRTSVLCKIQLEEAMIKIFERFFIYKDKETNMWYKYGSEPVEVSIRQSKKESDFDNKALVNYNLSRCIDEIIDNPLFEEMNKVRSLICRGKEFTKSELQEYSLPVRNYLTIWRNKEASSLSFTITEMKEKFL